jgi:hypothetical protein
MRKWVAFTSTVLVCVSMVPAQNSMVATDQVRRQEGAPAQPTFARWPVQLTIAAKVTDKENDLVQKPGVSTRDFRVTGTGTSWTEVHKAKVTTKQQDMNFTFTVRNLASVESPRLTVRYAILGFASGESIPGVDDSGESTISIAPGGTHVTKRSRTFEQTSVRFTTTAAKRSGTGSKYAGCAAAVYDGDNCIESHVEPATLVSRYNKDGWKGIGLSWPEKEGVRKSP